MYDYIIIGGGPAGCCLANRLSENPDNRVLLLEAGETDRHPYYHFPVGFAKLTADRGTWGYETVPQKNMGNRAMPFAQGHVLGGGSSINAQVYTRGNGLDYDEWESMGCKGWGYKDVLHYHKVWENNDTFQNKYHSAGGPVSVSQQINPHPMCDVFLQATQEVGLPLNSDFNGKTQEGFGKYQVYQGNARRSGATTAYIKPARSRQNLTIESKTLVTKILLEGKKAVGIEYQKQGSNTITSVKAGKEIIVTSGAVGSPKLLMLSGIGDGDELKELGVDVQHHLPGVGKNFHDHVDLYVVSECTGPHSYDNHTRLDKMLLAGMQYLLTKKGPVTSNLAEAGGFWYTDQSVRSPDLQFHFMIGAGLEYGLEKLEGCGLTLNSAYLRPKSRGTVKLKDKNPMTAPLIDPNYWGDEEDIANSIKGFRLARKIMRSAALKPYLKTEILPGTESESDEDIISYAHQYSKTDYHPVGSCKMGVDDMAVVDPALRVCGIENLIVADSSIIPKVVSSNTNGIVYTIAEKAADLILKP